MLQTTGVFNALIGVAVSNLLPLLVGLAALYAINCMGEALVGKKRLDGDAGLWLVAAASLLLVVAFLWSILLALLGCAVTAIVVGLWRMRGLDKPSEPIWRLVLGACALLAAVFLVDDGMWLPHEVFESANQAPLVGYSLADDDDILVLRGNDRTVLRLAHADVTERWICQVDDEPWFNRSVRALAASSRPRYPLCPRPGP